MVSRATFLSDDWVQPVPFQPATPQLQALALTRTSRNQKGGSWPLADEARGSRNRLLTRAALILAPEFPATFGTNFMM